MCRHAANMIGVKKNIIIVNMRVIDIVMSGPVLVWKSGLYETEEGCLSLDGIRKTKCYKEIEVEYFDFNCKREPSLTVFVPELAELVMQEVFILSEKEFEFVFIEGSRKVVKI